MENKKKLITRLGIFDSGLGGLSVAKELQDKLAVPYTYIADTAHVPYGDKPIDLIEQYCLNICNYLMNEYQVEAIIIACHTVSSVALPFLKQKFPTISFIGMVDLVCRQAVTDSSGKIGVMATKTTIASHKHKELIVMYNPTVQVFEQACPNLVPLIEQFPRNQANLELAVYEYLQLFIDNKVDTIVLGCTHYAIIVDLIKKLYPMPVNLVSAEKLIIDFLKDTFLFYPHSSFGTNDRTGSPILGPNRKIGLIPRLLSRVWGSVNEIVQNDCRYLATGNVVEFEQNASLYMQQTIKVEKLRF